MFRLYIPYVIKYPKYIYRWLAIKVFFFHATHIFCGGLKRKQNPPTIDIDEYEKDHSSLSITGEFLQHKPRHSLQDVAQLRPALLQEQRVEHPFLHAHLTIFNKDSGAGGISVLIGLSFPSFISHPQLVGDKSTLLIVIHTLIWW